MAKIVDRGALTEKMSTDAQFATRYFSNPNSSKSDTPGASHYQPTEDDQKLADQSARALSWDVQNMSQTQLRLALAEMRLDSLNPTRFNIDEDKVNHNILSVEFLGQRNVTIEAGSGKIFDPDRETARFVSEIKSAMHDDTAKLVLSDHIEKLNPVEMRLVANRLQTEARNNNWYPFRINRDEAANVLAIEVGKAGKEKVSVDATNGKQFDADLEAALCLGHANNALRPDKHSRRVLPDLLSGMSKGELSMVTSRMNDKLPSGSLVEKFPRDGQIDAVIFHLQGKELIVDLEGK